jgi:hypothetical protein
MEINVSSNLTAYRYARLVCLSSKQSPEGSGHLTRKKDTMQNDIEISGNGFFAIQGKTAKGKRWMLANVQDVRANGTAFSDTTWMVRDIADGATKCRASGRVTFPKCARTMFVVFAFVSLRSMLLSEETTMNTATIKQAETTAATYESEQEKDAYFRGFDRGFSCASWQNLPEPGEELWTESDGDILVSEDNQWDVVQSLAYAGESNDRQFSPFEFTAHEFNESDDSDSLWEAFDAGISDGISANIRERQGK